MDKRKRIGELKKNPKNVRFEQLCKIAEEFGFRSRGGKGSHRIFVRSGIHELLKPVIPLARLRGQSVSGVNRQAWDNFISPRVNRYRRAEFGLPGIMIGMRVITVAILFKTF